MNLHPWCEPESEPMIRNAMNNSLLTSFLLIGALFLPQAEAKAEAKEEDSPCEVQCQRCSADSEQEKECLAVCEQLATWPCQKELRTLADCQAKEGLCYSIQGCEPQSEALNSCLNENPPA